MVRHPGCPQPQYTFPHPAPDGVYVYRDNRPPRFQRIKAPDKGELEGLTHLISQRVGRCLERQGLLEPDAENAWLDLDPAEDTDAMPQILGSSVSYRIAVGPQQRRRAFMIRTIRPLDRHDPGLERVAKANGFSLHAGVSCEAHQKDKREHLCPTHYEMGDIEIGPNICSAGTENQGTIKITIHYLVIRIAHQGLRVIAINGQTPVDVLP
jgi:hypothetical protein